jgi:hypothetical protein
VNNGVVAGVASNDWKSYRPAVRGVLGDASSTDPVFDPTYPGYQAGRYIIDNGIVRGWVQLGLVGTFNPGTGSWCIQLPVPARRPHPSLPVVIGTGMVYFSFVAPFKNVKVVPILADPALRYQATNNGGGSVIPLDDPDAYFQLQCPYQLRHGTGTIASGQATATTNLDLNVSNGGSLADYQINVTEATLTNNCEPPYLQSTGSTQSIWAFQAATGAKTYAYKVRTDALTQRTKGTHANVPTSVPMMGYRTPFDLSELTALGPFGNIFVSFRYAPV